MRRHHQLSCKRAFPPPNSEWYTPRTQSQRESPLQKMPLYSRVLVCVCILQTTRTSTNASTWCVVWCNENEYARTNLTSWASWPPRIHFVTSHNISIRWTFSFFFLVKTFPITQTLSCRDHQFLSVFESIILFRTFCLAQLQQYKGADMRFCDPRVLHVPSQEVVYTLQNRIHTYMVQQLSNRTLCV